MGRGGGTLALAGEVCGKRQWVKEAGIQDGRLGSVGRPLVHVALRCELCCTGVEWWAAALAVAARTQARPSGQAGQLFLTVARLTLRLEQGFRKTEDPRRGLARMLARQSHLSHI